MELYSFLMSVPSILHKIVYIPYVANLPYPTQTTIIQVLKIIYLKKQQLNLTEPNGKKSSTCYSFFQITLFLSYSALKEVGSGHGV